MVKKFFLNLVWIVVCLLLLWATFLPSLSNIPELYLWIARIVLGILIIAKAIGIIIPLAVIAAVIGVIWFLIQRG